MDSEESPPPLSEAQTEIMNVIWERGEITLAQLSAALAERRDLARNTVQTQLTRLVEKGWLRYRAEGKAFYYSAAVPRQAAQSRVVQRVLDAVFGGSAEGLMMTLFDGRTISRDEADRIRALIEKAERDEEETA